MKNLLLILAIVLCETSAVHTSFLPAKSWAALVDVRGGAIDDFKAETFAKGLDPVALPKVHVLLALLEGVFITAAPEKIATMYGKPGSPFHVWWCNSIGKGLLSLFVAFWCIFWEDTTLATAVGCSSLVWMFENLRTLIKGDARAVGLSTARVKLDIVINAVVAYGCLNQDTRESYRDVLVKSYCAGWSLIGLIFLCRPSNALELWGYTRNVDFAGIGIVRTFGLLLMLQFGSLASMAFNDTPAIAAYQSSAIGFYLVMYKVLHPLINTEMEKIGRPNIPCKYFWLMQWNNAAFFYLWLLSGIYLMATGMMSQG